MSAHVIGVRSHQTQLDAFETEIFVAINALIPILPDEYKADALRDAAQIAFRDHSAYTKTRIREIITMAENNVTSRATTIISAIYRCRIYTRNAAIKEFGAIDWFPEPEPEMYN